MFCLPGEYRIFNQLVNNTSCPVNRKRKPYCNLNKLHVKNNGTTKFLLVFETLFLQVELLDLNFFLTFKRYFPSLSDDLSVKIATDSSIQVIIEMQSKNKQIWSFSILQKKIEFQNNLNQVLWSIFLNFFPVW